MDKKEREELGEELYHAKIQKQTVAKKSGKGKSAVTQWFAGEFDSPAIESAAKKLLEEFKTKKQGE